MKFFKLTLVNDTKTEVHYISIEVTVIIKRQKTVIELGQLNPPTKIPRKSIKKGIIVDTVL
jgi:hypothetical protein